MPENSTIDDQDWLVPAILAAVVLVVVVIVGIVIGVRAGSRGDDSIAGQLERWSSCLRSEGANVPLVESLRDGGFRITVDGSLLDEGLDYDAVAPALDACENEAPDGIRQIVSLLDTLPRLPFDEFGTGAFRFDDAQDFLFDPFQEEPRHGGRERRDIAELCERGEHGGIDEADIPPRLRRVCKRSS
ncbi:MAG: hypothetical protein BMS9Abin12_0229 [Acidimicrobiia bacterium]|nr:MAG: hypothetical protein BMS9Abin12_0229 [Acidimicrobiia bacterium]